MQISQNKKKLIFFVVSLVVLIVVFSVLTRKPSGSINIVADGNTTISVATERGGEFREVGKGETTYSSADAGTVFIRGVNGENETITLGRVVIDETTSVELDVEEIKNSSKLANESLAFPFVEDGVVQGLNPSTRAIEAIDTAKLTDVDTPYLELPFMSAVYWRALDEFAYISGPVAGVSNGKPIDIFYDFNGRDATFIDVFKTDGKPFVYLGLDGIYTGSRPTSTPKRVVEIESFSSPRVFSDSSYIYFVDKELEFEGDEGVEPQITSTLIDIYNYSGKKISSLKLDNVRSDVSGVVSVEKETVAILSEDRVVFVSVNTESASESTYYFTNMYDIVNHKGQLVVLNELGVWSYESSGTYKLLDRHATDSDYVTSSLSSQDGKVLYSTSVQLDTLRDQGNTAGENAVYQIDL